MNKPMTTERQKHIAKLIVNLKPGQSIAVVFEKDREVSIIRKIVQKMLLTRK